MAEQQGEPDKMYIWMYTVGMSKSYSVADARANLPDILDDVEAGREVQLTRRGLPVAVVISRSRYEALRSQHANFGDAYRAFVGRFRPVDIGLEPDFFDSIRDQAPGRRVRL
jgi:prevent-host-death family protein